MCFTFTQVGLVKEREYTESSVFPLYLATYTNKNLRQSLRSLPRHQPIRSRDTKQSNSIQADVLLGGCKDSFRGSLVC